MSLPPAALTITVEATLGYLDGAFADFAAGVSENRYCLWLGSGISLGRVDGLGGVVGRVLEYLRSHIEPANGTCRFRSALEGALSLAQLSDEEAGRVDLSKPFSVWPDAGAITRRLISNYARLLDITVDHEADDFLLWDVVDVPNTYAAPTTDPDVEHLGIAILILEGVTTDIASANWDGLIEKAVATLSGNQPILNVYAKSGDLQQAQLQAKLYKFHGCAIRATADQPGYRDCLIARQSQINGWSSKPSNAAMVSALENLISTKPTLMMGLSTQDANIQALFAKASTHLSWPWPGERPSYVFSENTLGNDQLGLLKNVYGDNLTAANRQLIWDGALIQAFAKPLSLALILHVLTAKLHQLASISTYTISPANLNIVKQGLISLRDLAAPSASADHHAFLRNLVAISSRVAGLFRDGRLIPPAQIYSPLTAVPIQQIQSVPGIGTSGLPELAICLGLLGLGVRDGSWQIETVDPASVDASIFTVNSVRGTSKVLLVSNGEAAMRLTHAGHLKTDEHTVVIHSTEILKPAARSPRGISGRSGRRSSREFSIAELLSSAIAAGDLNFDFRKRAML